MSKKITPVELIPSNVRTVRTFDFDPADAESAAQMGVVIAGPAADRIIRAVGSYNMAARLYVEAGYLLLSAKGELPHGEFEEAVEGVGLTRYRAAELMRSAKFVTRLPEAQRAEMLNLPKSKVLLLASADPAVIEDLLENDDDGDLATLSVRDLRVRIRELEASNTDLSVKADTAEAERDGALKKLQRRQRDAEDSDGVPVVVADIRLEIAALLKKAELAVTSLHPVTVEAYGLRGNDQSHDWSDPTLRLALSGLLALRELVDGGLKGLADALGDKAKRLASHPEALSFLDELEVKAVAAEYANLVALHSHEEALRKHERDQAKPKGKGRPVKAPEAPKAKA